MSAFPARSNRGIGLLGGTFDPVHSGHLAIARQAIESLALERIEFLLAPRPWQKRVVTSDTARAAMIRAAIAGDERLRLNLTEVFRDGLTYTIDTLRALREETGPAMPVVLLMGIDQWANLTTWKSWRELTDFASLAVFNRGGESPAVPAELEEWAAPKTVPAGLMNSRPCGLIGFFRMQPHLASSTEIRRLLAAGAPTREAAKKLEQWLPHGTASYIHQHGLYARSN